MITSHLNVKFIKTKTKKLIGITIKITKTNIWIYIILVNFSLTYHRFFNIELGRYLYSNIYYHICFIFML